MAAHDSHVVSTATTRSNSPVYGYESPNEENQPCFFSAPSPTPSVQRAQFATPVQRPVQAPGTKVSFNRPYFQSNQSSINDVMVKAEKRLSLGQVTLKDRIACYQWTYFTMTMATGGIANVLHSLPYHPPWVFGLGVFFCLLNLTLFLISCIMLSVRFYLRPGSFVNSFTDQVESLFIPAFLPALFSHRVQRRIAIILINICEYGVPNCGTWLLRTMEIAFWIYIGASSVASAGLYLVLWSTLVFPVHMMTPTWVFPAYPLLISAPFAANLIDAADISGHTLFTNKAAIALCATATQGTGCLIAFMISAAFIYRLMTQKLPRDMQRPGVFISIGPFGFTAAGIAQLGGQAKHVMPDNFLETPITADVIKVVSALVGLWLWGLSMWFFLVSVGSLWKYVRSGHKLPFQMTWWSFVFPNTALVIATEAMADVFHSNSLHILGAAMAVVLVVVWVGVFLTMFHCLRTRKLLWPKDAPV
ncbi:hypothetical protein UVI_02000940 [Ustilaginoidea virens]|uniref:C4-dicarboxylate transporter/malic acid transport protein n=1 Tax=Ustilaginoidea virens TaxID=1159556 RepID=A0A1B5KTN1_USTVR|nr:hypothetical protein UVI_02000940 [Ustilaginoidea virens]